MRRTDLPETNESSVKLINFGLKSTWRVYIIYIYNIIYLWKMLCVIGEGRRVRHVAIIKKDKKGLPVSFVFVRD